MRRVWLTGLAAVLASVVLANMLVWPAHALAASNWGQAGPEHLIPAIAQLPTDAAEPISRAASKTANTTAIDAAALFEQTCAGCHSGGGNIIRRGKNLKAKALKRYGMDSPEAIANIITNGKGTMSAYGEAAEFGAPTRLTAPEIEALADYVLAQAAVDWK